MLNSRRLPAQRVTETQEYSVVKGGVRLVSVKKIRHVGVFLDLIAK